MQQQTKMTICSCNGGGGNDGRCKNVQSRHLWKKISAIKKKKGSHSLFSLTCCLSRHKGVTKSNNQLRRKCLESVDMIFITKY